MNRALRRPLAGWAAAGQVVLGAVTGVSLTGTPAAAAAAVAGTVLAATPAVLPTEVSSLATGKRISYVSTSVNGGANTATGLVLTPTTDKQNKTVVWGHGTTGLADNCA